MLFRSPHAAVLVYDNIFTAIALSSHSHTAIDEYERFLALGAFSQVAVLAENCISIAFCFHTILTFCYSLGVLLFFTTTTRSILPTDVYIFGVFFSSTVI